MRYVVLVVLGLATMACSADGLGAPCARHSDCVSRYCDPQGVCGARTVDAGADGVTDATNNIPDIDADLPPEPDAAPEPDAGP